MDLLNPVENIKEYKGVPVNGLKKGMVKGVPFNLYMDMIDVTKQGVMGNPAIRLHPAQNAEKK